MIDVARGPSRFDAREMQDARDLIAAAISPAPRCAFVHASSVRAEYVNNIASGEKDLRSRIGLVSDSLEALEVVERWLDPAFAGYVRPSASLAPHLRSLSHKAKGACTILNRSSTSLARAMKRVATKTAPAKQGKDSTSDCLILEEYLELGRSLTKPTPFPVVMLTSNKTDFGTPTVEAELAAVGIGFAMNWGYAKHLLGL